MLKFKILDCKNSGVVLPTKIGGQNYIGWEKAAIKYTVQGLMYEMGSFIKKLLIIE
jgi:hypothetical protein